MEGPKPDPAQLTSIAIQKYEYKKLHKFQISLIWMVMLFKH
jgi:hypothetical protein